MNQLCNRIVILFVALLMPCIGQSASKSNWAVRCDTQDNKSCYIVQNVFLDSNKRRLAGLAFHYQQRKYIVLASVPLGVNLRSGINIKIDNKPYINIPYQICNPQGCHGGQALTYKVWRSILRAKKLSVIYQDPVGRGIGVPFSPNGLYKSWRESRNSKGKSKSAASRSYRRRRR